MQYAIYCKCKFAWELYWKCPLIGGCQSNFACITFANCISSISKSRISSFCFIMHFPVDFVVLLLFLTLCRLSNTSIFGSNISLFTIICNKEHKVFLSLNGLPEWVYYEYFSQTSHRWMACLNGSTLGEFFCCSHPWVTCPLVSTLGGFLYYEDVIHNRSSNHLPVHNSLVSVGLYQTNLLS